MRTKTALLHIGTPKTGTTSIQECLARAEAAGALQPYRYPLFSGDRNHNRLTMLYLPHRDLPQVWLAKYSRDDDRFRRAQLRYRRFLFGRLRSADGAILSAESLSNHFSGSAIAELRRDLESLGFSKFHVVLYIRDPADFYLSRTQQALKWSLYGTSAVDDPASFRYRFRQIAETWEQAFPGSVTVRRYASGAQHDVSDDFSEVLRTILGVDLPRSEARLNTTLSAEAMVVLQDYRETIGPDENSLLIPGLDRLAAFLAQSAERVPQTRPTLNSAFAMQIRANHREDAEFIKSRYGVDLGLGPAAGVAPLAARPVWRVEDILESLDLDVVECLREEYRRAATPTRRPLAVRAAARAYRSVPYAYKPARLEAALRSRFMGGPQT
jgi:hypothetical protein